MRVNASIAFQNPHPPTHPIQGPYFRPHSLRLRPFRLPKLDLRVHRYLGWVH